MFFCDSYDPTIMPTHSLPFSVRTTCSPPLCFATPPAPCFSCYFRSPPSCAQPPSPPPPPLPSSLAAHLPFIHAQVQEGRLDFRASQGLCSAPCSRQRPLHVAGAGSRRVAPNSLRLNCNRSLSSSGLACARIYSYRSHTHIHASTHYSYRSALAARCENAWFRSPGMGL